MLKKTCNHCHQGYRLEDVTVDEHANSWSFKPAYCYCPHCGSKLNVDPDTVDLAKHFKPVYVIPFLACLLIAFITLATNGLHIAGPVMLGTYGFWLGKSSKLRDHRIIGWLLVVFSLFLLCAFNYWLSV